MNFGFSPHIELSLGIGSENCQSLTGIVVNFPLTSRLPRNSEREREIAAGILAINRNNNRDESSCLFVYIPAVILVTLTIARR